MGLIQDLQAAVAGRIRALPALAPEGECRVQVLVEDAKDLENELNRALAKLGVGITILTPTWKRGADIYEIVVTLDVEVVEAPAINRGPAGLQITSLDLCQILQAGLHRWVPQGENLSLGEASFLEFMSVELASAATPLVRTVRFDCHVFDPSTN